MKKKKKVHAIGWLPWGILAHMHIKTYTYPSQTIAKY